MRSRRIVTATALVLGSLIAAGFAGTHGKRAQGVSASASATASGCRLGNGDGRIKHVIYLQFDNTHYRRDRANVASDLEQMPHLLRFLRGNGTLLTNDHTILISHTAGGILASLTGLYPDRNGQTVSNSFDYFKNDGTPAFAQSFKYWTDTVDGADDPLPNMITDGQATTPAPWLTYTHAGCDVGGFSAAPPPTRPRRRPTSSASPCTAPWAARAATRRTRARTTRRRRPAARTATARCSAPST
jgi:hypothetical protein